MGKGGKECVFVCESICSEERLLYMTGAVTTSRKETIVMLLRQHSRILV